MKINKYIRNISVYDLKKSIPKYLKRVSRKDKLKIAEKYNQIIELKRKENLIYAERLVNSVYFKLASIITFKISNIKKMPEAKQTTLFFKNLVKIQKWCDLHKVNPGEYIKRYNYYSGRNNG